MKRLLPWISLLVMLLMVSCTLPTSGGAQPAQPPVAATSTLSPDQIQTQISEMLTQMPTVPGVPADESTATPALPTVPVAVMTATPADIVVEEPTATDQVDDAAPTATSEPATATPAPTATQAAALAFTPPPGDPRNRLGPPESTDPMDNPDFWVWPTGSDQYTYGEFANGTQAITSLDTKDGWRMANPEGRAFTNLYLEGTFKTAACAGFDHYGLMVRVPVLREPDQGYLFGVTCDGRYSLRRWNGEIQPRGEMKRLVDWTASDAIAKGSNQVNRLGIFTVGNRLVLYINGQKVNEVQDNEYSTGNFGVFVGHDATKNLVIQVDEMSYWENPQP